jgi:hypothetical protein
MALKEVSLGGKTILVEVAELPVEGKAGQADRFENTAMREKVGDLANSIRDLVEVVTAPARAGFEGSQAEEWAIELNIGFKGQTGLPFVAKGEANAAVKITAKWKKPSP